MSYLHICPPGPSGAGSGLSKASSGLSEAGYGLSEAGYGLSEAGFGLSEAGFGLLEVCLTPILPFKDLSKEPLLFSLTKAQFSFEF